jgi:hypothetical protein
MSLNDQYDAKVARRARLAEEISVSAELRTRDYIIDDLIAADYAGTAAGSFHNVDRIFLRWDRPDWFEYIPTPRSRPAEGFRCGARHHRRGAKDVDGGWADAEIGGDVPHGLCQGELLDCEEAVCEPAR